MLVLFLTNNSIVSRLIRWWTNSEFSHVVLVKDLKVISAEFKGGVKELDLIPYLNRYTTHKAFIINNLDEGTAWEFARSQVGKPYDHSALFGFLFRKDWQEPDSWFCSELIAASLLAAGKPVVNRESHRVTPQDLLNSILLIQASK